MAGEVYGLVFQSVLTCLLKVVPSIPESFLTVELIAEIQLQNSKDFLCSMHSLSSELNSYRKISDS